MINLNLTYEEAEKLQNILGLVLSKDSKPIMVDQSTDFYLVKIATRLGFNILEEWRAGTELIPLHIPVIINYEGKEFKAIRTSLADSYHPKFQEVTYTLVNGLDVTTVLDTSKFSWRRL